MLLDKTPNWQVWNNGKIFDVLITTHASQRGEKKKSVLERNEYIVRITSITNCNKIVYM